MAPTATTSSAGTSAPPSKRSKAAPSAIAASSSAAPRAPTSHLFTPFRSLGYITNSIPSHLIVRRGGKDAKTSSVNMLTCLGNSWALWDLQRTTLLFVGTPTPRPIVDMAVCLQGQYGQLAAAGSSVYAYERGKCTAEFVAASEEEGEEKSELASIITYGTALLALARDGSKLFQWNLALPEDGGMPSSVLSLPNGWKASVVLHPDTYVDKVLLGSTTGALALWNVRTSTLLHTFPAAQLRAAAQVSGASAVVDLVQSPALDVVGVAFADGHVLIHDVRHDEALLFCSVQDTLSRGALAFRTDGSAHTLAIGTAAGDIHLFDLSVAAEASAAGSRPAKLIHTLRSAHQGPIASLRFIPSHPLLVSTGADNALRQWFFEPSTAPGSAILAPGQPVPTASVPRLLKSREGHSAPPHIVRHYGDDGRALITAGEDRSVRLISVVRDSRSAEMSQGHLLARTKHLSVAPHTLKLPRATSLSFSTTRARDWDDVLSTHAATLSAHSWSTRNRRMGAKSLLSGTTKTEAEARTSAVSACGNFGLVGDAAGVVRCYNMQSGILRRSFVTGTKVGPILRGREKKEALKARKVDAVTGVDSDALNNVVVVATLDGRLSIFDFHTTELLHVLQLGSPIASLHLDRATNLVALTHDDLTLRLLDITTYRVVRHFTSFRGRILDVSFSPDGRWLLVSSLDGLVRTYDIPTSRLVDAFRPAKVASSISFSPTGDFLATTHVGELGVSLWANRAQFAPLALRGMDEEEVWNLPVAAAGAVALPGMRGEEDDAEDDEPTTLEADENTNDAIRRIYTSPPQLLSGGANEETAALVTLTTMPRTRWMTLLNLDTIKRRNKPTEAPKKPERAPFFLPQVAGTEMVFDAAGRPNAEGASDAEKGRLPFGEGLEYETELSRRLKLVETDENHDAFFIYLHALSPPALDGEIRSLSQVGDMTRFIRALTARLAAHRDYEAVQALVALLARVHSDVLLASGIKCTEKESGMQMDVDDENEDEEGEGRELAEAVRKLLVEMHREGNRVMELLEYCLGSLAFVRDLPLT